MKEKDDKDFANTVTRDAVLEARNGLIKGFVWSLSKEGSDYWHSISVRLIEIAELVKHDEPKGPC